MHIKIYLFICDSFYDAVSISDCILSDGGMTDDLCVVKHVEHKPSKANTVTIVVIASRSSRIS